MIKVKDGYAKLIGVSALGAANQVLLSNGGNLTIGNAKDNIPLNNGTVNTNLNADLLDGKHNGELTAVTINPFVVRVVENCTWGTLSDTSKYTYIKWFDESNGGGLGFSSYDSKLYMLIDGDYYANKGKSLVLHTGNYSTTLDARYYTKTESDNRFVNITGDTMTGPLVYSNVNGNNKTSNYFSAGGGFGTGSGRLGLKLVAIDLQDILAGIGVDLTGFNYETCLSTGRNDDATESYITFATHTKETTSYKLLGYFLASGASNPVVLFNVNGNIQAKNGLVSSVNSDADAGLNAWGSLYLLFFGVGSANVNRGIYDRTNGSWWIYRDATVNTLIPQGNVGIGTTNPTYKLQVAGAGVFNNTGSTTYASNGITIGAGDTAAKYITCYGKTGLSYINIGYNAAANNSGELHFRYSSSGSTSNYVGLLLYGAANSMKMYPGNTTFAKPLVIPGELYSGNYGINMSNSDIIGINALYTSDNAENGTEGLQFSRGNGYYDSLWASSGVLYFSPNGNLNRTGSYNDNYTVWHTGNLSMALNTITKSIKVTTSWQNTGITGANIGSGAFIVRIEPISDYSNGGLHYTESYVGLMCSYAGTTNSTVSDEIPLHRCGHAPSSSILYLRTIRTSSSGYVQLQIAGNYNMSAALNITFKFRRII